LGAAIGFSDSTATEDYLPGAVSGAVVGYEQKTIGGIEHTETSISCG
jgi:hypothetical protein